MSPVGKRDAKGRFVAPGNHDARIDALEQVVAGHDEHVTNLRVSERSFGAQIDGLAKSIRDHRDASFGDDLRFETIERRLQRLEFSFAMLGFIQLVTLPVWLPLTLVFRRLVRPLVRQAFRPVRAAWKLRRLRLRLD